MMYHGYFDESGDLDTSPGIFCVAGYYLTSEAAHVLDSGWRGVLAKYDLPYFHMVDCAHRRGVFVDRSMAECAEIETALIGLIKQHTKAGFAALANASYFEDDAAYPNAYSAATSLCVIALQSFIETNRLESEILYFFESGHKHARSAYVHVANRLVALGAKLTFRKKDELCLLQAADLLAWQACKYAKDYESKARPPRKDFLSLVEHRHTFAFLSVHRGESIIAVEEWPRTERVPATTMLTVGNEPKIMTFHATPDETPIIIIKATAGWGIAFGQMASIAFEDIAANKFILGFEETRLYDAMIALIAATDIFTKGDRAPTINASKIWREVIDGQDVVFVRLNSGGTLGFRVPMEAPEGQGK